MRIVLEERSFVGKETCVSCGLVERPTYPAPYAYEGGVLQGWVCEDCFGGGPDRIKESLRSRARDLHTIARNLESLAESDIEMPSNG
jgi:hypothetical protein